MHSERKQTHGKLLKKLISAVQCAYALPRKIKFYVASDGEDQQMAQLECWHMNSPSVLVLWVFSTQESEVGMNWIALKKFHADKWGTCQMHPREVISFSGHEQIEKFYCLKQLSGYGRGQKSPCTYLNIFLSLDLRIQCCSTGQITMANERLCPLLASLSR